MAEALRPDVRRGERTRDARPLTYLDDLREDWRVAFRTFARAPLVPTIVILTLVLGIGLNAVVFSVFNGLLFRAQVSRDPASFVRIYLNTSGDRHRDYYGNRRAATVEEYEAIRSATHTLSAVTASKAEMLALEGGLISKLPARVVSCNYLAAHHGSVLLGRGFGPVDCGPGAQPVAVLSRRGWTVAFGSDPSIVGRTVRLKNQPVTVIGVTSDELAGEPLLPLVYVPYTVESVLLPRSGFFRHPASDQLAWLDLMGRLATGATVRDAQNEINVLVKALDRRHSGRATTVVVTDGALIGEPGVAGRLSVVIGLVLGTTMLVLLLVCTNVTTLLLARATARRHEMAVRVSLGGTPWRLVRQLLSETLLLALVASAGSVVIASYVSRAVAQTLISLPVGAAFEADWRVVGYSLGLALMATAAAGVSPAVASVRLGSPGVLNSSGSTATGVGSGHGVLIAYQISITLALVVGAVFAVRAQQRMLKPQLGYDPNRVVALNADFSGIGYSGYAQRTLYDQIVQRLLAFPGVEAVALCNVAPFQGAGRATVTGSSDETRVAWSRAVSPAYFRLTGVPVVRGSLFSSVGPQAPGSPTPIIVSEALASALSTRTDVLGQRIQFGLQRTGEIVGVAADVVSVAPSELDGLMLYQPIDTGDRTPVTVLARVSGDPRLAIEAFETFVRRVDRTVPVTSETIAASIARVATEYNAAIVLSSASSVLALCLSFVGLFAMMMFAVAQRAKEISIRLALGAQRRHIVELFMRSLLRPLMTGLSTGIPMALLLAVLLRRSHVLVAVNPADPWPYGFALTLVVATVIGATLIPVVVAARTQPSKYLRQD
jgi:predicted permease